MLFDIPYITDWSEIGKRRQQQVDRSNTIENKKNGLTLITELGLK